MTAGFTEVVVFERRDGTRELRKTVNENPPDTSELKSRGYGELQSAGFEEVRRAINLDEYESGEHVATIYYHLDDWNYSVEFHVRRPLLDRIADALPPSGVIAGESPQPERVRRGTGGRRRSGCRGPGVRHGHRREVV